MVIHQTTRTCSKTFRLRSTPMIMPPWGTSEPQVPASIHGNASKLSLMCLSLSQCCSALKRTKEFKPLENTRPTLRNKPSGLRSDWHRMVTSKSPARPQPTLSTSSHSSSLSVAISPTTPSFSLFESDHTSSLIAMTPLPNPTKQPSPLYYGDLVPLPGTDALGNGHPNTRKVVFVFYLLWWIDSPNLFPSHGLCRAPTRMRKAPRGRLE
jgi:hypothetical protein